MSPFHLELEFNCQKSKKLIPTNALVVLQHEAYEGRIDALHMVLPAFLRNDRLCSVCMQPFLESDRQAAAMQSILNAIADPVYDYRTPFNLRAASKLVELHDVFSLVVQSVLFRGLDSDVAYLQGVASCLSNLSITRITALLYHVMFDQFDAFKGFKNRLNMLIFAAIRKCGGEIVDMPIESWHPILSQDHRFEDFDRIVDIYSKFISFSQDIQKICDNFVAYLMKVTTDANTNNQLQIECIKMLHQLAQIPENYSNFTMENCDNPKVKVSLAVREALSTDKNKIAPFFMRVLLQYVSGAETLSQFFTWLPKFSTTAFTNGFLDSVLFNPHRLDIFKVYLDHCLDDGQRAVCIVHLLEVHQKISLDVVKPWLFTSLINNDAAVEKLITRLIYIKRRDIIEHLLSFKNIRYIVKLNHTLHLNKVLVYHESIGLAEEWQKEQVLCRFLTRREFAPFLLYAKNISSQAECWRKILKLAQLTEWTMLTKSCFNECVTKLAGNSLLKRADILETVAIFFSSNKFADVEESLAMESPLFTPEEIDSIKKQVEKRVANRKPASQPNLSPIMSQQIHR